ncbi:MAG TPA: TorF family putative porin, partial [Burkholderiales bacterium]|nr:TorF family putative porin [Burkholderiales bacterium]
MKMMPKVLLLAGLTGLALAAGAARAEDTPPAPAAAPAAPEPDYTLAWKLGLWSEYEYRGISQSSENPAAQLNIDFTHKSGFYLGTFLSNIKWLKDTADVNGFSTSANLEWDIYGGY